MLVGNNGYTQMEKEKRKGNIQCLILWFGKKELSSLCY